MSEQAQIRQLMERVKELQALDNEQAFLAVIESLRDPNLNRDPIWQNIHSKIASIMHTMLSDRKDLIRRIEQLERVFGTQI